MEFYNFRLAVRPIYETIVSVATLTAKQMPRRLTKKQVAQARANRVPTTVLEYGAQFNGMKLEWQAYDGAATGYMNLLPVQDIYGVNLKGELYFENADEDPRLRTYRPVDQLRPEASVGLLHDARRSGELFYYNIDDELRPTGIDLIGYFELLQLSLGVEHWQYLLVVLAESNGQARPLQLPLNLSGNMARRAVAALELILPHFSLAEFVARYDAVKLLPASTWAEMVG